MLAIYYDAYIGIRSIVYCILVVVSEAMDSIIERMINKDRRIMVSFMENDYSGLILISQDFFVFMVLLAILV